MNRATILIAEDDAILAAHLESIISSLDYAISGPVASGEEAVAAMAGQTVDLVLMDIELAGAMNGITAAEQIAACHDVPIIFLTGFSQNSFLERAKKVAPYGYLIKPIYERELAATLEMALHRHALDRRLKESRAALEKSEAKYRQLFESLPIGIFRTSLDGKILDGNREMVRIVGCVSPGEVLEFFSDMPGRHCTDPGRRLEFISLLQKHGSVNDFIFPARNKDGETIWISIDARLKPADASGGPAIEGFARDITDWKRAEEALLASEERYRMVSSLTSDLAYSCSGRPGNGFALNWMVGAAEEITGYSLNEIMAHRCWSFLVAGEDMPLFERYILGLAPGMSSRCELRLRHRDGSVRRVECTTKCLVTKEAPDGTGIFGSMVDRTDRRHLEETLRMVAESGLAPGQDIFRFLGRHLSGALKKRYVLLSRIYPGDPTTAHTLAVWQDGAFADNFSYPLAGTPCEIVVTQGACFYPADVRKYFPSDPLLVLMGAESYWGTSLRDGAGNLLGLLAVLDDRPMEDSFHASTLLTTFAARAATELERKRTEEKYQSLFREMMDGFAIHEIVCDEAGSPVDYRFLAANPAFEQMTGLRSAEIVGKTVREVLPQIESHWIETYGKVALTGEPVHFANYSPFFDKTFEITAFRTEKNRFACIIKDISGQKRAEEERTKLQEQLYHAQRMEDIGRLTGGVAHDFNNHLTAIIGCSQFILAKLHEDSELRHFADMINSAGEKAAVLTRSLLTFSRKEPPKKKPVDVQLLTCNISRLLRRLIGEDIDLVVEKDRDPLFVNADSGHIEQVLMNLATNARDAMPDGGTIRITLERRRLDREFMNVNGWGEPGEYAVISFSDTGVGIPVEDQERIFEPFYTSKDSGNGTGLGLPIVLGIIRQHGGHILLDSAPGRGTTFTLYLPLIGRHHHQDEPGEQPEIPGGAETVLICEDDESVRRLIRMVLQDAGYEVLEAVDGQEAVEAYQRNRDRIHLVILDVVMPKKNGVAAYGEIFSIKPGVRTLFTSGYTPETINRSGVFDMKVPFIQKPITPGLLLKKVRETLDGCDSG